MGETVSQSARQTHTPLKARKVCNSYAPYIDNQLKCKMFLRDSYKKGYTDNKNIDDCNAYKKLKSVTGRNTFLINYWRRKVMLKELGKS